MKLSEAKATLALRGITITKKSDEYRVNYRHGGTEESAYYTNDIEDAVATGLAMAAQDNAPLRFNVETLRDSIAHNPSLKSSDQLAGAYYGALTALAAAGFEKECKALKAAIDREPKFGAVEGRK